MLDEKNLNAKFNLIGTIRPGSSILKVNLRRTDFACIFSAEPYRIAILTNGEKGGSTIKKASELIALFD